MGNGKQKKSTEKKELEDLQKGKDRLLYNQLKKTFQSYLFPILFGEALISLNKQIKLKRATKFCLP